MFRVAKNVRADYFDRLGRAPSADPAIEMIEQVDEGPTPSDVVEQSESVEMLKAAMERLPTEKRELLVMARFEFLKHDEIASLSQLHGRHGQGQGGPCDQGTRADLPPVGQ